MATPRSKLVDPTIPYAYHLISRCVRRSFLCGKDPVSRRDYTHRKKWIIERMELLAQFMPVEVYAFAIMSNHMHLVVYYDPQAHKKWSKEEVATRWCAVCPKKKRDGRIDEVAQAILYYSLLANETLLEDKRQQLGSLSNFMKWLKQPIACAANREDGCSGHFFEQRFYSGVLLSETAMLAAMAYVDLNPVRAKVARKIEEIDHASITRRMAALENSIPRIEAVLDEEIGPVMSGSRRLSDPPFNLPITLRSYLKRLAEVVAYETGVSGGRPNGRITRWIEQVQTLQHRQRAYGSQKLLQKWTAERGMQAREWTMGD